MPRPKRDAIFRYEEKPEEVFVNYHDDEEDSFLPRNESAVVEAPQKRRGKGKRSLEDMMTSLAGSPPAQSVYALERIAAAEDQIAKILKMCSPEAREIVLRQRPSMQRYAPEED